MCEDDDLGLKRVMCVVEESKPNIMERNRVRICVILMLNYLLEKGIEWEWVNVMVWIRNAKFNECNKCVKEIG